VPVSKELAVQVSNPIQTEIASVNGVALHSADETPGAQELRQRACSELLRQAAIADGLLGANDVCSADGVLSEQACIAIELLLERKLPIAEPSEQACQRHYAAQLATYSSGERVRLRHLLFAVTPGVDVVALRNRAETTLLDVRCHDGKNAEAAFAKAASTLSNCPSGAEGGELGWLTAADCAPEFAKEIFGQTDVGVLPRLVHTRFGLHVVEVLEREAGEAQAFEAVRGAVAMALRQQEYVTALRQYLALLEGQAVLQGIEMELNHESGTEPVPESGVKE
jgi:peptidyl-prolyl cis-trans isomerase C